MLTTEAIWLASGIPSSISFFDIKISDNTWVLAYTRYDRTNSDNNGQVVVRVSTNDGATWGSEQVLRTFYRAASGVTVTSNGSDEIRIGFSWDNRTTRNNFLKRTIVAYLSGANLVYDRMIYENEATRTQPVFTKTSGRFLQAWREVNFLTSVNTRFSDAGTYSWANLVRPVSSTPVTPALAAYRNWSYSFLFYLDN